MKISLLPVAIIALICVTFSMAINPFESTDNITESLAIVTDQLAKLAGRFDHFQAEVKDEISRLKAKNTKQAEEIRSLKEELNSRPSSRSDKVKESDENKKSSRDSDSPRAVPSSCRQLEVIGYVLDGFYILQNVIDSKVKLVYCEFGPVSETRIGNIDVKSTEVHFYVQRSSVFSINNAIVQFNKERLNVGEAMDMDTGIFSAPVNGVYQFEFNGIKDYPQTSLDIFLRVNGANTGMAHATSAVAGAIQSVLHASLKLKAGDRVSLYKTSGTLYDAVDFYFTHFTGRLVSEDLVLA